jgi:enoyl-CoA hydratase
MTAKYSHYDALKIDWAAPGVLRIAFNRPEERNAMNDAVHRQISDIWLDIDDDEDVRSVLVCGEGDDFCAGGELGMVVSMLEDREQRRRTMREAQRLVYNMINCAKPIVSAMQGSAIGGGLAVGLLADISIAAKDARLLDGHVRIGLAAGDHAVLLWPLLCGLAKAKYHVMMNKPLSGEEAERIGLIAMAVDKAELAQTALDAAEGLAGMPAPAIRRTKYAFNGWLRAAGPHFDLSSAFEEMSFETDDVVHAVERLRERKGAGAGGPAPKS